MLYIDVVVFCVFFLFFLQQKQKKGIYVNTANKLMLLVTFLIVTARVLNGYSAY